GLARAFNPVACEDLSPIDCGFDFFRDVHEQFEKAAEEVVIMPFVLRPRLRIFSSDPAKPPDTSLADLILKAIRRGVHVWIMGWDNAASEKYLGTFQDHEYELLFEAAAEARQYLHLMLDTGRQFLASVFYLPHIKSYVFDRQVAYVGGIDFAENRDDTFEHLRPDPLLVQVSMDERHPSGNEKPWQDAMVKVTGRAAEQVAMILVERWWTYCQSTGMARSQAMRPVTAILDTLWHVKGALHGSEWKDWQCEQLPKEGLLGKLQLVMHGDNVTRDVRIDVPQIQSSALEPNSALHATLSPGKTITINVTGLHALDQQVPAEIFFSILGKRFTARPESQAFHLYGSTILARWLPEGIEPDDSRQMCKVTLSGSNMWMGSSSIVQESYRTFLDIIRNAKRYIFIENQYFSSDFPSTSAECQHMHDPTKAVLYSGATNRIGEVLLDRVKRAVLLHESFSVAFVLPLATEPGSFYPNLRGAYCFEQAVEDFCKAHNLPQWRDYFSFFFLANAVKVPDATRTNAFYGIFTHTKATCLRGQQGERGVQLDPF
ncbi:unnamed protein product, partial [Effrenium voratum]